LIEVLTHSVALETEAGGDTLAGGPVAMARARLVPLLLIAASVATVMAYSLLWGPLVLHHPDWLVKGDIWGTFRTAQFVSWGDIGDVYRSGGGLVGFPGISVLLAPIALVVGHTGLSGGFPYGIPHPTAWLVLGPSAAILGSIVLIPLDALAEFVGLNGVRRIGLSIAEAVILWPVVGIWGHPEDSLALAFGIWGLLAVLRGKWRAAGWFWGLAVVMQPLVVLMMPIAFAMAPRRRWPGLVAKASLPSGLLVAVPLAQAWSATTQSLFRQPNFPTMDHPTPWMALAPVISKAHTVTLASLHETQLAGGSTRFDTRPVHIVLGEVVAAGPGRLLAIGLAVLLGVYVYRHPPTPAKAIWLCCVALSLRCVFETVMDPFYLCPPLALGFVTVAGGRWRVVSASIGAVLLTWWSYRSVGPWEWWLPMVLLLGVVVVSAMPPSAAPQVISSAERTVEQHAVEYRKADRPVLQGANA